MLIDALWVFCLGSSMLTLHMHRENGNMLRIGGRYRWGRQLIPEKTGAEASVRDRHDTFAKASVLAARRREANTKRTEVHVVAPGEG